MKNHPLFRLFSWIRDALFSESSHEELSVCVKPIETPCLTPGQVIVELIGDNYVLAPYYILKLPTDLELLKILTAIAEAKRLNKFSLDASKLIAEALLDDDVTNGACKAMLLKFLKSLEPQVFAP